MAELLDLDAEVMRDYLDELTSWLADLADPTAARIIDAGAGTGTGTLALLRQFQQASVTAFDVSEQQLARLERRAAELGLSDRVTTAAVDLNGPWPQGDPADIVWAASSLHHLDDTATALKEALGALRPGGLLAATEMESFPRVLPDDLGVGRPGLETRLHALLGPGPYVDWSEPLRSAGFALEQTRSFEIDLPAPAPAATGAYAAVFLTHLQQHQGDRLEPDDRAALSALLDPESAHSLLRRTDLHVRTRRTTWVARRPA